MKILVVDDEHSFGSLLGRTLRRLGHKPVVAVHPEDALAMLQDQRVDAVITDLDMPVMNGVDLARAIRAADSSMPVAFCTGSTRDDGVLAAASELGQVLPKIWTVADVKAVVISLQSARARLARGSEPKLRAEVESAKARAEPSPPPAAARQPTRARTDPQRPLSAPLQRRQPRKLRFGCQTWEQVLALCDEQGSGKSPIHLRGKRPLDRGERIVIALSLPDELVLSIAAEVLASRPATRGEGFIATVSFVGLTPELCARMRAMATSAAAQQR